MILTADELELMKANSLRVSNAREITDRIKADRTIEGIFPNGNNGDFTAPDIEKFSSEWFENWEINLIMLRIARSFADEITANSINALIDLGNCQQ
jgi:hypothetical protein